MVYFRLFDLYACLLNETMPRVQCAVVGCTNGTPKINKWKETYCPTHKCFKGMGSCVCPPPFTLFSFPTELKDPHARKIWIKNVGRKDKIKGKNWQPKEYSRVCSEHFKDGMPTEENPYPDQNMCNPYISKTSTKARRSIIKYPLPSKKPKLCTEVPVESTAEATVESTIVNISLSQENDLDLNVAQLSGSN